MSTLVISMEYHSCLIGRDTMSTNTSTSRGVDLQSKNSRSLGSVVVDGLSQSEPRVIYERCVDVFTLFVNLSLSVQS